MRNKVWEVAEMLDFTDVTVILDKYEAIVSFCKIVYIFKELV